MHRQAPMKPRFHTLLLVFVLSFQPPALAGSPPPMLFGKTIVLSWTVNEVLRGPDGGTITPAMEHELVVYISKAGRLFVRAARRGGQKSQSRDFVPGDTGAGIRETRFVGSQLVSMVQFVSGASQLTADFNPGYRDCRMNLVMGKEHRAPVRVTGISGTIWSGGCPGEC